ncbi:MAG TPA: flagellar protein FliT [Polyangiaceae bacterium]|nr:flagellar protein FliT [Polyangiaceae bacterium]
MSSFEALMDKIESVALELDAERPDQLLAALATREALLVQLQGADTSSLLADARARLKARLHAVLARDTELLHQVTSLRSEIKDALAQLKPARAATRAYRETVTEPVQGIRRIG